MSLTHISSVRMAVKLKPRASLPRKAGKANRNGTARERNGQRIELGEHVVADPLICHGKLTYKGTRIMVWQILDELEHGMSVPQIVKAWGGRVSKAAILETIALAHGAFLDAHGRLSHSLNGHSAA
jgi:uncharacterized protein (DUF433 family)